MGGVGLLICIMRNTEFFRVQQLRSDRINTDRTKRNTRNPNLDLRLQEYNILATKMRVRGYAAHKFPAKKLTIVYLSVINR